MIYGISLRSINNKELFSLNSSNTMVLTGSFTTEAPNHTWSSVPFNGGVPIIPMSLAVVNFPPETFPSFDVGTLGQGINIRQPYFNIQPSPPPKPLRINIFTPKSLSYNDWDLAHRTYQYGIEGNDEDNKLMISPALNTLIIRNILTATVAEISAWLLSREEFIATEYWKSDNPSPYSMRLYIGDMFKSDNYPMSIKTPSDPTSYNYKTGISIISQPVFYLNLKRYLGAAKTNVGRKPYAIYTCIYQDNLGNIGIAVSVISGRDDYLIPTIVENLKPFMAIICNTENYN
jgi:hypothetical protein